ncbi:hypothetical protein IZY60_06280 [Lutibacter sp. B2]|nr:hypothetical protein [Lutibacter sp. B2]
MGIEHILDYYRNYENVTRFMQNSLTKSNGEDYSVDTIYDSRKINAIIENKKIEAIYEKINLEYKSGHMKEEEIPMWTKFKIKGILDGGDIDRFMTLFDFKDKYRNNKRLMTIYIKELVEEKNIIICYPMIQRWKVKQPIITFKCRVEDTKLIVEEYFINSKSLNIILAYIENCSTEEIEDIAEKKIKDIMDIISNIQDQSNLDEIIKIINDEIFKRFKNDKINSILDFEEYEGWMKVEKIFITTDELNEIYEPIFREEIKIIKEKIVRDKENPSLLNKYIEGAPNANAYEAVEDRFKFHFGSYTGDYPINKKQWDVVGSSNNIQLLSVNGPPGTGKTTLLKEIIADNIVEKARKLIEKWDDDWEIINKDKKQQVYRSPFGGKNNHSIVITSANNKAVDNIGEELLNEISYFDEFMNHDNNQEINYKGMLCARLGKKDNINIFKWNILNPLLKGLKGIHNYKEDHTVLENFKSKYREMQTIESKLKEYDNSRKKLKETFNLEDCSNMKIEETKVPLNEKLVITKGDLKDIESNLKECSNKLEKMKTQLNENKITMNQCRNIKDENEGYLKNLYIDLEKFDKLKRFKFMSFLLKNMKDYFNKYPTKLYIEKQIDKTEEKINESEKNIRETILEEEKLNRDIKELIECMDTLKEDKKKVEDVLFELNSKLKEIDEYNTILLEIGKLLEIDHDDHTDLHSLISCDKVVKIRKELFDFSLKIQEEYIKKHRDVIVSNLEKMIENGRWFSSFYNPEQRFKDHFKEGILSLWETLFLCFPVVTTTLHSFGKNIFQMIPELMDLLLVDEAGQILPHYLVGPLYRAKRAIVVGDVYQLEPIRLYDKDLIADYSQVGESLHDKICVEKNSAQHYVDNNSDIYEIMDSNRRGIVLDEHRRCEESIVKFSNEHVYGKKLKIVNQDKHDKLFGKNNIAFDIRGIKSRRHINEAEVIACKKIVEAYVNKYGNDVKKDIAIITPFKNQEARLKQCIKNVDIGTVHTFQGQEKKYIIISTVIDSNNNSGICNFVGGKPNLLNVGFTRAKEQVIVVGNIEVTMNSGNYLEKAIKTIREEGIIYSIYDEELNQNTDSVDWDRAYRIFIEDNKYLDINTRLGSYLSTQCSENIIVGSAKHYEVMKESIARAQSSIYIFSPWITNYVVNEAFMELIRNAKDRNVDLKISFGYHKTKHSINDLEKIIVRDYPGDKVNKHDILTVINGLKKVLGDNIVYKPPLHTKLILIDEKFLFIGSHNWLSNSGKKFDDKDEVSCILTDTSSIEYIKRRYINKFFD